MDDFLVFKRITKEDENNLNKFLKPIPDNKVTLNLEKFKFHQTEVEFLGHRTSSKG